MKRALAAFAILVAFPYACAPLYQFPEPRSFSGPALLNPYSGVQGAAWQRANLHAHSRQWGGLTNGHQPAADVVRTYQAMGYSVAGVSDYHSIAAHEGIPTIPLYEHGYNLVKRHQLAIGARRVDWFDFPLWQTLSNQQFVIDRLGRTADLVALNHPPSRDAYTPEAFRWLAGYHLLEVVNGPHRSEESWDAALSSGHPVWVLANDDTHDLRDPARTGVAWTMIAAASSSTRDVVDALRAGRAYAVSRTGTAPTGTQTVLSGFDLTDGTLTVTCIGEPSTFTFVGQNGVVRKTAKDTLKATYTFSSDDTYIRTVIRPPGETVIYLNPVLRYDGVRLSSPAATVNVAGSWLQRGLILIGIVAVLAKRRQRKTAAVSSPQDVRQREDGTTTHAIARPEA